MMAKSLNLKVVIIISFLILTLLVGCTGVPIRLKSTADKSMRFLSAEMATHKMFLEPVLVDQFQITDDLWCLTYEIGPDYFFSSRWVKQENEWIKIELQPYVENCAWAQR